MNQPQFRINLLLALCAGVGLATLPGCGPGDAPAPASPRLPLPLVEITRQAGLDFVHTAGDGGDLQLPEIMGAGVGLFDQDGDGDLDIYLSNQSHLFYPEFQQRPGDRLYRRESDGSYVDVTEASGLGDTSFGQGVAIGDVDNDGDLDLYVSNYGRDRFYRNRGDGTFVDDTERTLRADTDGWSCSAAFFDYDRDGFLDLYVTQYVLYDHDAPCMDQTGRHEYCGPTSFPPVADLLLHNRGDGTFDDVSDRAGMSGAPAAGLGVVVDDFNGDSWPDLYVANDAYANQLWINGQDGTFRDDAVLLGAAYNLHGDPEAGMGVVAADFDNNGYADLFVTNLSQETNTYYRSLGPVGFDDATGQVALGSSSMSYTGFGTVALDLELDGDIDLVVANGRVTRGAAPLGSAGDDDPWAFYAEPNLIYLNDGAGFVALDEADGGYATRIEMSRGLAVGDIDLDGDLDLLLGNIGGPARLYLNEAERAGNWLIVAAYDPRLSRHAIGARVVVTVGDKRFVRRVSRAYSYLSSGPAEVHFGLGPAEEIDRIDIEWPDGKRESFGPFETDRRLRLERGSGKPAP